MPDKHFVLTLLQISVDTSGISVLRANTLFSKTIAAHFALACDSSRITATRPIDLRVGRRRFSSGSSRMG
jgi:hypothetical protein